MDYSHYGPISNFERRMMNIEKYQRGDTNTPITQ